MQYGRLIGYALANLAPGQLITRFTHSKYRNGTESLLYRKHEYNPVTLIPTHRSMRYYTILRHFLRTVIQSNKLVKFADDTYLLIPASNADSRSIELKNVETWARASNLTLNNGKTKEIIVVDRKRRRHAEIAAPQEMPVTARVTSVTVLGVTWTNGLSASEHVRAIINSCAKTLYALRVLRAHSLNDVAIQAIYRSVILAKLRIYTLRALDGDSRRRPIENALKASCVEPSGTVSVHRTPRNSKSYVRPPTTNFSIKYKVMKATFYTHFCRLLQ